MNAFINYDLTKHFHPIFGCDYWQAFLHAGVQLAKWYFLIETPIMLASGLVIFFVWKYRKLK